MKKFRIVLIVATVVLLALPPLFGVAIERQVGARIDAMNADGPLAIAIDGYDRGWFSSTAQLTVAPAAAIPVEQGVNVPPLAALVARPTAVVVDFTHGPVSVIDGFFVGITRFLARAAEDDPERPAAPYAFEFRGQTTFGGTVHFVATLPPFDRQLPAGAVSFSGGRISGTVAGRSLSGQATAATLQMTRGAITWSLQGIDASVANASLAGEIRPSAFELTLGRASLDLGGAGAAALAGGAPPGAALFDASGIVLDSAVRRDPATERLDATLDVRLDNARFGADTHVTGAQLSAAAYRLDATALEAAREVLAAESATGRPDLDALAPPVDRLLAAGPAMAVRPLRFDVDGAPLDASLSLETAPDALPAQRPVDLKDAQLWRDVLRGTAEITAEKGLVERFAAAVIKSQLAAQFVEGSAVPFEALDTMAEAQAGLVLAMLATQGIIADTGNVYRMDVRLENGALSVNGRTLPLDLL